MVTDLKNKQFHEGTIQLSTDDVDALAKTMQDLSDDELEGGPETSLLTADESRLDRELFERFGQQMPLRSMKPDPTCIDDQKLWSRIHQARASSSNAKVVSLRPRNRAFKIWSGAAAVAAGIFLSVRLWEPERDLIPSSVPSNFKGVIIKEGLIKEKGCDLGLSVDGVTIKPEAQGSGAPASRSILFMVQCQSRGYLHLQLVSGDDRIIIPNIPVEESRDLRELMDQDQKPVGIMTPNEGFQIGRAHV